MTEYHTIGPQKVRLDTWNALKSLAESEEISVSAVVRKLLRDGVARELRNTKRSLKSIARE